jgi:hypothetical protein
MKNLILLMAGLFIINLTANSLETVGLQTFKSVPSDETEMVESVTAIEVKAGQLSTILTDEQLNSITNLTLTGTIDARDFKTMRDLMPVLANLDLTEATIAAYTGTDGTSMEGETNYPANAIPEFAFMYKKSLLSVDLPISATEISTFAFANNWGLTSITISPNIVVIKRDAFGACWNVSQINISASVEVIEFNAFDGNQGLFYVDDGNQNFSSLDGVLFDKRQKTLISCPRSKSGAYTIPNTVEIIEYIAFGGCYQLTNIHIPSSVKIIRDGAFDQCYGIVEFVLPSSIEFIGNRAFFYCYGMTSFEVKWKKPLDLTGRSDVFLLSNVSNCKLKVPFGTSSLYATAEFWKDFQNIIEMEPEEKLTYVPDENFEQALIDLGYDLGPLDNYVPTANISGLTYLDVSGKGIEDITGIQDFVSLQALYCFSNNLTSLDVSKNSNLRILTCGLNQLSRLDVSENLELTQLSCDFNLLTEIDVSKNNALESLYLYNNKLSFIDVSQNTMLTNLSLAYNQLTTIDVSKNTALIQLGCEYNQLTSINISNNTMLEFLSCYNNILTNIDVTNNSLLTALNCQNNLLNALDVSKNTDLTRLYCSNNLLTSLNIKNGNNFKMIGQFNGLNAQNNPNLMCLQVDDPSIAETYAEWIKDSHAIYSNNCSTIPVVFYPSDADIVLNNGQTYNITWSDFPGSRVKIELLKENAVTATISASTPNDGSHFWTIPAGIEPGDDFRIMITSMEDRSVSDISDNFFTIQTLANPLVLVPSEPGIIWNNSKTYIITWSGFTGSKVRIELIKGNVVRSTIAASTANDGSHPWTIAKNLESGSDYKIKIASVENRSVTDISDFDFTIQPATDNPGKKSAEIEIGLVTSQEKSFTIFPNPFNSKVNFEVFLKEPAKVVLEIYTITGLKLSTLFDGNVNAGVQTRFEYNPEKIPAQVLLYKLRIGDELETGKLIYKP